MYREVTCWNTGNSYLVTDTENIYNGYVAPRGVAFYSQDEDSYYTPVRNKTEFIINKAVSKPSIYKRGFLQSRKETEYKYAFTERKTRTTVTDKDVYYNDRRNRFISRSNVSIDTKTEYNLPRLIVW